MHVTIIQPNMMKDKAGDAMEPLVFAILAGLTPPDIEMACFDERIEDIPLDQTTDLVAITVDTFSARRAYQLAAHFRKRNVPVVMGGFHPTMKLNHAATVVMGDAEDTWPELVRDAGHGRLKRIYASRFPKLEGLSPDRSVYEAKQYRPVRLIQFGRGCPFVCDFCSIHAFYGNHIRYRPLKTVLREIEENGRYHILFTDDNLFADMAAVKRLVNELDCLKVRWSCQAGIDVARHPELIRKMAKAGCVSVLIGFESLNRENLRQMKKFGNLCSDGYEPVIRRFHENGIMVNGTFVFGYDRDTRDSFDQTLEFALRSKLCLANFNPLTPTPGTPLYRRLKTGNRLIQDPWWLNEAYHYGDALFHPMGMSAEELKQGCYRARSGFNRYFNICRRALSHPVLGLSPYKLGLFMTLNLISGKEIHRKQGAALGPK